MTSRVPQSNRPSVAIWAGLVGITVAAFAARQSWVVSQFDAVLDMLGSADMVGHGVARPLGLATIASGLALIFFRSSKIWSTVIAGLASLLCLALTADINLASAQPPSNQVSWAMTPTMLDRLSQWVPGIFVALLAASVAAIALRRDAQVPR